jgi:hypothetical protein
MIKNKILNIISHLKQFPPRPKISEAIQEMIEALSKSGRLHPDPNLRQITLKPPKQNLTHQVSKPGTRWSVTKGSTRRSDRSRKSRRSRKTRRSKHRK